MPTLPTWAGRSSFSYEGSVETGTVIQYGQTGKSRVTASKYKELRDHFRNNTVSVGTSHTSPPPGSLGAWLLAKVTPVGIASYVAPILIYEGYAAKVGRSEIRITR